MSTSIDERVVEMKFKNSDFEKNTAQSMSTLQKLKQALNLNGAKDSLAELGSSAKKLDFSSIAQNVDSLSSRFSNLGIVAIAALGNITSKAVDAGLSLIKSLTIDPILNGFSEYETKLGSIQTILANTQKYGTTLGTVNDALNDLNNYADKTIYNFGDMTKNIGLFTNAGIKVEDATSMIKGFSNAAAASGTSAQGASSAAYQLSQALSTGTIRLMDWRSLTNVGMGNKNMQNSLIEIADAMGTVSSSGTTATAIQSDFNGSLEKGWLSADVMSKYLQIMAGDMSDAEMASMGLTQTQIDGLKQQAATAEEAATKVRTWTQLVGTLAEAVGSGWSKTFEILLGGFNEATDLFTGISDEVGGLINNVANARNKMLQDWKDLGGRDEFIQGFKNLYNSLKTIVTAIHDAFTTIFPPTTGQQLLTLTKGFVKLTEFLKVNQAAANGIKTVFLAVFSVLKVGVTIIKGVLLAGVGVIAVVGKAISILFSLVGVVTNVVTWFGNLIHFTELYNTVMSSVKDFGAKAMDKAGTAAKVLGDAFSYIFSNSPKKTMQELTSQFGDWAVRIDTVKTKVIDFSQNAKASIESFVTDANGQFEKFKATIEEFRGKTLEKFKQGVEVLKQVWDTVVNSFQQEIKPTATNTMAKAMTTTSTFADNVKAAFDRLIAKFKEVMSFGDGLTSWAADLVKSIANKFKSFVDDMDFQDMAALVNTGFFILLYKALTSFLKKMGDLAGKFGELVEGVKKTFDQLTKSLKTMQQQIKIKMILELAAAIAILAASLWVISQIDVKQLGIALGAITVMLIELTAVMKIVSGMDFADTKGLGKVAMALLLIAGAVLILAIATEKLSGLDWEGVAKGLVATSVLLGGLLLFTKFSKVDQGGLKQGAGLLLLAGGVLLLAEAVSKLGTMDTGSLIQGMVALTAVIGVLTGFTVIVDDKKIFSTAAAMVVLGGALILLAGAIKLYSMISWETLGKGLTEIALALATIGIVMQTFPKDMVSKAAGLLIVAAAITLMTKSLETFGNMSSEQIAGSLIMLAGSLTILSVAVDAFDEAKSGAVAMLIMAAALTLLTPSLVILGNMSMENIGKGLLALAGALVVMAGVAIGLSYFSAQLLTLGVALLLIGAAGALFGAGIKAVAEGILLLVGVGAAGVASVTALLTGLIMLIPLLAQQIGYGIRAIAVVIAESGPELISALTTVLISLATAVGEALPSIFQTITEFLLGLMQVIIDIAPQLGQTVLVLLQTVLDVLVAGIPMLVNAGIDLINGLLEGIASRIGETVTAALNILTNFLNGIAQGIPGVATAGANVIIAFITSVGAQAGRIASAASNTIITFINSLTTTINRDAPRVRTAARNLAIAMVDAMTGGLASKAGSLIGKAKSVVSSAVNGFKEFFNTSNGASIASNVVSGLVRGISGGISQVTSAARDLASKALSAAKNFLGINSPSKEFEDVGMYSDKGFAKGLLGYVRVVTNGANAVGSAALTSLSKSISGLDSIISDNLDASPTITPVLDLSDVTAKAGTIGGLLGSQSIDVSGDYASARDISDALHSPFNIDSASASAGTTVNYTQTINSPKAVSAAETYRNTKNLLSVYKKAYA